MPDPPFPDYLAALVARLEAVAGSRLVGVWLLGSAALGDFDPARSDLDATSRARRSRKRSAPRSAGTGQREATTLRPCSRRAARGRGRPTARRSKGAAAAWARERLDDPSPVDRALAHRDDPAAQPPTAEERDALVSLALAAA